MKGKAHLPQTCCPLLLSEANQGSINLLIDMQHSQLRMQQDQMCTAGLTPSNMCMTGSTCRRQRDQPVDVKGISMRLPLEALA